MGKRVDLLEGRCLGGGDHDLRALRWDGMGWDIPLRWAYGSMDGYLEAFWYIECCLERASG